LGGILLWLFITILCIKTKSLANTIEVFGVAGSAVMAAYLKFLVFDRYETYRSWGLTIAVAIVTAVTVGLSLFMPVLPE